MLASMTETDPRADAPLLKWSDLGVSELLSTGAVTLLRAAQFTSRHEVGVNPFVPQSQRGSMSNQWSISNCSATARIVAPPRPG